MMLANLLLSAALAATPAPAPTTKAPVKKKPAKTAKTAGPSGATGSGSEPYTPTKCEWLAVELNSNYRVSTFKPGGFTLQIYCRPPSTIFLSYRYLAESDRDAAMALDDQVRDAIGQVALERNWKWIQLDGELVKAEPAGASGSAAAPAPAAKAPPPPASKPASRPSGEEEETISPEQPPGESMPPEENGEAKPGTSNETKPPSTDQE